MPRRNSWQLDELAGDTSPQHIQQFIRHANRNAEDVRDDLLQYVVKHRAQKYPVLINDETGFVENGETSAGVGTPAGWIPDSPKAVLFP